MIPNEVLEVLRQIREGGGNPPPGYKGGADFFNTEGLLPPGTYREYDVHPLRPDVGRGPERLIIEQQTRRAYYTGTTTGLSCRYRVEAFTMTIAEYLRSKKPPWIGVLRVADERLVDRVVRDVRDLYVVSRDLYVATVEGRHCRTKDDLMTEFTTKLEFPHYFGRNWDAFVDCLRDFGWLPLDQPCGGYAILVRHPEELLIESSLDYATFVGLIDKAGEHWGTPSFDGTHRGGVAFHVLLMVAGARSPERDWGVPELDVRLPPGTPRD